MPELSDGIQTTMFGVKVPAARSRPTQEELEHALQEKVRIAVFKWHRGRPPKQFPTFDDLHQEVKLRTLRRLHNFTHGGKKTLGEFTYVAACYSLADIQREDMRRTRPPPEYPLLDEIDGGRMGEDDDGR